MSNKNLIPVSQTDYLDQDPPIRGQKYVCLSFVSPEDVIKNKEVYFFQKYLKAFSHDLEDLFEKSLEVYKENKEFTDSLQGIKERYAALFDGERLQEEFDFYKAKHSEKLEGDYLEKNNFQTTIRGLKVRGSYETQHEAQIRAQVLKRMDDKFHVFIAEVGCWCPWAPNPDELENQEYAETQLNTLVKGYHDNQKQKDEFFLQRKDQLRQRALEENEKKKEEQDVEEVQEQIANDDPWLQRKGETSPNTETSTNPATIVSPEVKDEPESTESV
jgi:hypothetical protein